MKPEPGVAPCISVVVPTRNRAPLLARLLDALDSQQYARYEVIVVDDASNDATPDVLAKWRREDRHILRLDVPSGSYAARNRGWMAAAGSIVAFTDDDCVPQPEWLNELAPAFLDSAVVGAQGVTLARPGGITPFTHQIEQRHAGPPYRTCNIAYRRSVLESLGGFDANLHWYADNILGYHACRLGSIAFEPRAVVYHPPRSRDWRDRNSWLARFRADAAHRLELQRLGVEPAVVSSRVLPIVLWMLRPLLKQAWAHARYAYRHPTQYVHQIGPMAHEKWELIHALREYWRGEPDPLAWKLPSLPDRPLVSVIVVTRDRPHLLNDALTALQQQTWIDREVIVVEHAACTSVRRIATEHNASYVTAPNVSLAAARQAGLDAAQGDIVAFTDDDCLANRVWLEMMVDAFRRQPELHGVQGRTEAERGPIGSHVVQVSRSDALYQTCNMAYRREALECAHGFDLGFQGWFEDTALAARVMRHGPIGFASQAIVRHRAMPRRILDRKRWRVLLEDERRLARDCRSFYWRTRGPGFFPTVIARWLLGSPMKTLLRELPQGVAAPAEYVELAQGLLRERREMLRALWEMYRLSPRS